MDYELLFGIGVFVSLLVLGFLCGRIAEKRHYASIRKREEELRSLMLVPSKIPPAVGPCKTVFVSGSVVVGMDYFKMAYSSLLGFFGGRITPFEPLLDRGRREAILRMKEEAAAQKATFVCNIKFSTANVMSMNANDSKGCVEVIAYGTAIIPVVEA